MPGALSWGVRTLHLSLFAVRTAFRTSRWPSRCRLIREPAAQRAQLSLWVPLPGSPRFLFSLARPRWRGRRWQLFGSSRLPAGTSQSSCRRLQLAN